MKRYTVAALVVISVLLGSAVVVIPVGATPTAQASGGFQSGLRAGKPWQSLEKTLLKKLGQSDVPDNLLALLRDLRAF